MISRCNRPKAHNFTHYGARGIAVCGRWSGREGYDNFLADMGEPPEGLTLDRINSAGNYEPANCRWATWQQQADNRDHSGAPVNPSSLRQRAIAAGLPYMLVYLRTRRGWTEERALQTPMLKRGAQPGHPSYR